MWTDNKYAIRRNPQLGGLYFSESSCFEPHIKRKFQTKFKELISKDETHPGIGFFPLDIKNNTFSFAMCQRVKGTKEEKREHDISNGFITNSSDEALDICNTLVDYITHKKDPLNLFFSEDMTLTSMNSNENSDEIFMLEQPLLIQLCQKIITLINDNIKLIIFTPDEYKYYYFCLLAYILIQLKLPLFITADMSCTLTAPDIMIISSTSDSKNLYSFTNGIHYEKISIEEFLNLENNHIIENAQKSKSSDEINSVLNECKNYLSNNSVSEYTLYATIDKFYKENNNYYGIFKNDLKDLLYSFDYNASALNRFITLTYIVFKDDTHTPSMGFSSTISSAPYDFNGMCSFLKLKATSTRQYYQFLKAMLSIQFKAYFKTPSEKLAFRDASNDVITDFLE